MDFFLRPIERYTFKKATHINLVSKGFESYFSKYKQCTYSYFTNNEVTIITSFLENTYQYKSHYYTTLSELQVLEEFLLSQIKELINSEYFWNNIDNVIKLIVKNMKFLLLIVPFFVMSQSTERVSVHLFDLPDSISIQEFKQDISQHMSSKTWLNYLELMRSWAQENMVTPRDLDKALFSLHRESLDKENNRNLYSK